ncbi:MAG TPA: cation:proton antiporter [Desulfovibrio sp.]|jgi:CPA2 family monovalent cation:H+ antiporter-2|uniref:cation:proton antiporter domain-containing protein n=1 Tax=Desulfovibrio sp. TaxID=885 RepID=UPI002A3E50C4|nr:cation:proton antiporter [Desulfovibrio sp.]MDY0306315.1 cation:proton antiporter [Desulfovibrionaceae bacterium]HMM38882.1 cation:proton antiporter [Desulfovibrio sp.]
MELPFFREFVIIFGLSIAVIYSCYKIKLPPIVGFLITGVLAGPYGFGLVKAVHEVETIAEIGVVLLLFTIGLELSLGELARLKKPVFLGGAAQVLLTIIVFDGLAVSLGYEPGQATFFGFLVALSSTAIVLRILQQRAEMNSPHGRVSLSILIFQDLIIVPMMLLMPYLSGKSPALGSSLLYLTLQGGGLILLVFFLARKIVPRILRLIVGTRSRELFLLTTLALCLSIAWLTSCMGLSLSLGAFMAGLIMSESEYSLSALEGILPFRDVFTSIFFISVGMLLNVQFLLDNPLLVAGVTFSVLLLKALLAGLAAFILGYPLRPAILVGLALCQVGEFSFVLAKTGLGFGLLSPDTYQLFLSASILTMALTPLLIAISPQAADRILRLPLPSLMRKRSFEREMEQVCHAGCDLRDHIVIIGFGVGGRHLARAAKTAGIPYTILEMNPDTVRTASAAGEPIAYGDATQPAVLEHAGIQHARVVVVVVSDPAAIRRITDTVHRVKPSIHIIVRTRFVSEVEPLRALGANDVIPEEFETSVEIFTRALTRYMVPRAEIERFTEEIRSESYDMLRQVNIASEPLAALSRYFTGYDVSGLTVEEGCMLDGLTLEATGLRKTHGLTVVAVRRGGDMLANPDGTLRLEAGDVAYVFGSSADIAAKAGLFLARKRAWVEA